MGNAATCCAPPILVPMISTGSSAVKVLVFSSGTIQVYTNGPVIRAADVMVENPGHFLCDSDGLKVGHRILGLPAEEELHRRQLYFLLPMELLYSVLTEEEMSSLTYKASKAFSLKRNYSNNLTKIFPLFSEFCMSTPSEGCRQSSSSPSPSDGGGDDNCEVLGGQYCHSLDSLYCKQRSWRPALETIVENPSR